MDKREFIKKKLKERGISVALPELPAPKVEKDPIINIDLAATVKENIQEAVKEEVSKIPAPKDGERGEKGDKGDKGDRGPAGRDGIDGVGKDGVDGKDGKDGKDGRDGKDSDPAEVTDEVLNKIKKEQLLDLSHIKGAQTFIKDQTSYKVEELMHGGGSSGGSPLTVTDGITPVSNVTTIDFTSGAVVTDGGGGVVEVAISGSGDSIWQNLSSTVVSFISDLVDTIQANIQGLTISIPPPVSPGNGGNFVVETANPSTGRVTYTNEDTGLSSGYGEVQQAYQTIHPDIVPGSITITEDGGQTITDDGAGGWTGAGAGLAVTLAAQGDTAIVGQLYNVFQTNPIVGGQSGAVLVATPGTNTFNIDGDITGFAIPGAQLVVVAASTDNTYGFSGNAGIYTVVSATTDSVTTDVVVAESIPASLVMGAPSDYAYITSDGNNMLVVADTVTTDPLPVIAVDTGLKTFTVAGDHEADFASVASFIINGSATWSGQTFTVASTFFDGTNTTITVNESIYSSTADGSIYPNQAGIATYHVVDPGTGYVVGTEIFLQPITSYTGASSTVDIAPCGTAQYLDGNLTFTFLHSFFSPVLVTYTTNNNVGNTAYKALTVHGDGGLGIVEITDSHTLMSAFLDAELLTADRQYKFPDQSGTLAIPQGDTGMVQYKQADGSLGGTSGFIWDTSTGLLKSVDEWHGDVTSHSYFGVDADGLWSFGRPGVTGGDNPIRFYNRDGGADIVIYPNQEQGGHIPSDANPAIAISANDLGTNDADALTQFIADKVHGGRIAPDQGGLYLGSGFNSGFGSNIITVRPHANGINMGTADWDVVFIGGTSYAGATDSTDTDNQRIAWYGYKSGAMVPGASIAGFAGGRFEIQDGNGLNNPSLVVFSFDHLGHVEINRDTVFAGNNKVDGTGVFASFTTTLDADSGGALTNTDLTFTANLIGPEQDVITIAYFCDSTPGVTLNTVVTGTDIVVNLGTDTFAAATAQIIGDDATSTIDMTMDLSATVAPSDGANGNNVVVQVIDSGVPSVPLSAGYLGDSAITNISGADITVAGDVSGTFTAGSPVIFHGTTGNDSVAVYKVVSSVFGSGNTVITIDQTPDQTVDGFIAVCELDVILGTDSGGVPDPALNTLTLVAAALAAVPFITDVVTGDGSQNTSPQTAGFSGGENDGAINSTANDVLALLNADVNANVLITTNLAPANDGTGLVNIFAAGYSPEYGPNNLAGGAVALYVQGPTELDGGAIRTDGTGNFESATTAGSIFKFNDDGVQIQTAYGPTSAGSGPILLQTGNTGNGDSGGITLKIGSPDNEPNPIVLDFYPNGPGGVYIRKNGSDSAAFRTISSDDSFEPATDDTNYLGTPSFRWKGGNFGSDGVNADSYAVGGTPGASGSFTTADAKTVTVVNGIITSIV